MLDATEEGRCPLRLFARVVPHRSGVLQFTPQQERGLSSCALPCVECDRRCGTLRKNRVPADVPTLGGCCRSIRRCIFHGSWSCWHSRLCGTLLLAVITTGSAGAIWHTGNRIAIRVAYCQ